LTHFSLEEWSDFARKRAPHSLIEQMQRHLDDGCDSCARVLTLWSSVLEVASRETGFQLPESGTRLAKALYGIPRHLRESLTLRLARLVFSSSAQPLCQGVRGAETATSHMLFEEGNYLLDLHLKPDAERNLVSVAGQILDRADSDRLYGNQPVSILRQNVELARTSTNEFGEFQLEFGPGEGILLAVRLEGDSVLVSALPASAPKPDVAGPTPAEPPENQS
jgi:hypothetical protein